MDDILTKEQQVIKEAIWRGSDMVDHPSHYTHGKIECIDAIEASMTPEEFTGFLKGQVIKYIWRFEKKWDPLEDLKKAEFYLDRLVEFTGKHSDIFKSDYSLMVQPTQELDIPKHVAETLKQTLDNVDLHD